MRTFKQFVESLCFLLPIFLGLALFASPFSFAKGNATVGNAAGLQVGQVWPAGNIGQGVDNAIGPGLFYEYQASDVFGLKFDWTKSSHNNGDLKLNTLDLAIKANLVYYDLLVPYAFLGTGLYMVDKTNPPVGDTASRTLFGINFGLGADLELGSAAFVGMYFAVHNIFAGTATLSSGSTYEVSGRWSGFFLRGGVRF